jgi:cytochrome P450
MKINSSEEILFSNVDVDCINFLSQDFISNPYPYYDVMREKAPILFRNDWKMFFLSAFEDVNSLLRDSRLGRQFSHIMTREEAGLPPIVEAHKPFFYWRDNVLMDKEPPDHTRLKSLVLTAFTPRIVEGMRPHIYDISNQLADHIQELRYVDLLEEFAAPLSVRVISELLGVPEEDRHRLRPLSSNIVAMHELGAHSNERIARIAVKAVIEFSDYLRKLIEKRRLDPKEDLLSALIIAEESGDQLTEDELIATCIMLLNAGHEATVNALGNGILALLLHQEQLEILRQNPEFIGTAVEEMLRFDTPLPIFRRWVLQDMTYKNFYFKKGMEVAFLLGSANRDPARFIHPNQFDITRKDNPHLAFGIGIHYCLGAPLARVELQIAINTLLRRFNNIQLISDKPTQKESFGFRGLSQLPISV